MTERLLYGVAIAFLAFGSGLVGKIVWDWLQKGAGSRECRVSDVPLRHGELDAHCERQRSVCSRMIGDQIAVMTETLKGEFGRWQSKVDLKLEHDHERFEKVEKKLDQLRRDLNGNLKHDS